jgi:hypothetical protein
MQARFRLLDTRLFGDHSRRKGRRGSSQKGQPQAGTTSSLAPFKAAAISAPPLPCRHSSATLAVGLGSRVERRGTAGVVVVAALESDLVGPQSVECLRQDTRL